MTTLREAAEMALSALVQCKVFNKSVEWYDERIAVIQEALDQPNDPVEYHGWVLREVLFDQGEPVGHRAPPPHRKPLSDEEIKLMKPICADFVSFRAGVRQAERVHGIGGEK